MATVTLSGKDSVIINGRILADLANADVGVLTFGSDLSTTTRGYNGNVIHSPNQSGKVGALELRVVRASTDDKFLQSIINSYEQDSVAFRVVSAAITKRFSDGTGQVSNDIYDCEFGVPSKAVETKVNTEGDVEQVVSVYSFNFGNVKRVLS